jgi:hypothetical protein
MNAELFTTIASSLPGTVMNLGMYLSFIVTCFFAYTVVYSFGAASLSYAYNTSVGSSYALLWAIWAFFTSHFYYPYYAFFLNPVGAAPAAPPAVPLLGGRRRK